MKWLDASEVVAGKIALGELHPGAVDAARLAQPMRDMVLAMRRARGAVDRPTLLVEKFGHDTAQSVLEAGRATTVKGDYIGLLYRSQSNFAAADKLDGLSKKLRAGEEVDYTALAEVGNLIGNPQAEFERGDRIAPSTSHFQPTYLPQVDDYLPGMPASGLWTLAGRPKEGKTSLAIDVAAALADHDEYSIIFSFEMAPEDFIARAVEMRRLTKKQLAHWHVFMGPSLDPDEVMARATQIASTMPKRPRLVVVDYADYLIRGAAEESKVTQAYITMARLGRDLKLCVLLLAQFNDSGYKGIPLPTAIRYGRMAIAASTMLTCIHHPARIWQTGEEDKRLPVLFDDQRNAYGYHIYWHSRFGFGRDRRTKRPRDVGAVQVGWSGEGGWSQAKAWYPLAGFSLT